MLRFKGYSEWQILTCHIEMQSQCTSLSLLNKSIWQYWQFSSLPLSILFPPILRMSELKKDKKEEIKKKKKDLNSEWKTSS